PGFPRRILTDPLTHLRPAAKSPEPRRLHESPELPSMNPFRSLSVLLAVAPLAAAPVAAAPADDEKLPSDDPVSELERKVDLLTDELARTRQDMGVPEEKPLESVHGLGPGASKIYGITKGLSIGGYAEGGYTAVVADKRRSGDKDNADFTRA